MLNIELKTRLKKILNETLNREVNLENEIKLGDLLSSLDFVKLVVIIEKEFDIEFYDEDLDLNIFENIKDIEIYIQKQLENK